MAYCKSCGAYIPDGQNVCLACGYDEAAEKKKTAEQTAAAAAAEKKSSKRKAGQFDSDFLRRELDEQRRRQQENSRKWAETEYAQRQKTRQDHERAYSGSTGRSTGANTANRSRTTRTAAEGDASSKIFAGLSYFSFLFVLPYFMKSDDKFATYHAKQGLNLFIAGLIGDAVGKFLGVGWLVTLARMFMIFKGVSNVVNDKKDPLPFIGNIIK